MREGIGSSIRGNEVWYHEVTLRQLQAIWYSIQDLEDEYRSPAQACFSATLQRSLSLKNMYGRVANNRPPKRLTYRDAFATYRLVCNLFLSEYREIQRPQDGQTDIHLGDAAYILGTLDSGSVQTVITSPPYPWLVNYHTLQRLTLTWLGINIEELVGAEIGAARMGGQFGSGTSEYVSQISKVTEELHRVLTRDSLCILIMGSRRRDRKVIEFVCEKMKVQGFSQEDMIWRKFSRSRCIAAFKIPEVVLIFRRL